MPLEANTQQYTAADYDYGRSAGHYEAAIRVGVMAVETDDSAVKEAMMLLREDLVARAEAITAEIRDREQVTA